MIGWRVEVEIGVDLERRTHRAVGGHHGPCHGELLLSMRSEVAGRLDARRIDVGAVVAVEVVAQVHAIGAAVEQLIPHEFETCGIPSGEPAPGVVHRVLHVLVCRDGRRHIQDQLVANGVQDGLPAHLGGVALHIGVD